MADGDQGNAQNPTDPETNGGDSNDVEEADEVHYIRFVFFSFTFIIFSFTFETVKWIVSSSLPWDSTVALAYVLFASQYFF